MHAISLNTALCCLLTVVSAQDQNAYQPPRDPRSLYSNNYTLPDQDFPGLQSNWDPPIDSGETSYVGRGRLIGRRALITGGDSGIGRAVAIAFAREGADVAINYLPEEQSDADDVVDLVSAEGRRIFAIPGDIRNETFATDMVYTVAEELGGLDIVVNNAGYGLNEAFIGNLSTESFDRTFQTNVYGAFYITRAAANILPPGGSIIFTTSSGANGLSDAVDYSSTKAVYVTWTRALAGQLGPMGIRVNAVAPGYTYTNFPSSQGDTTDAARSIGLDTPLGRNAQPAEMAHLYVVLAEEQSSFVSGSVFGANGGTGEF